MLGPEIPPADAVRNWMTSVFTDVQFWVPVAVLMGGLLLLKFIH